MVKTGLTGKPAPASRYSREIPYYEAICSSRLKATVLEAVVEESSNHIASYSRQKCEGCLNNGAAIAALICQQREWATKRGHKETLHSIEYNRKRNRICLNTALRSRDAQGADQALDGPWLTLICVNFA